MVALTWIPLSVMRSSTSSYCGTAWKESSTSLHQTKATAAICIQGVAYVLSNHDYTVPACYFFTIHACCIPHSIMAVSKGFMLHAYTTRQCWDKDKCLHSLLPLGPSATYASALIVHLSDMQHPHKQGQFYLIIRRQENCCLPNVRCNTAQ